MRTVAANVNVALEWLETRSECYFANPSSAMQGWLRRAEHNLDDVLAAMRKQLAARPDVWGALPQEPTGHLEDAAASFSALLDMFYEVDPDYVDRDGEEPLRLPDDEALVRSEAAEFVSALCFWARS